MLKSVELYKQRKREKSGKTNLTSKKIEKKLALELSKKLEQFLTVNDSILFEITPNVVAEFINILNEDTELLYDYQQVDRNHFIFSNKEVEI
ncbi:hypothetical protein D3C81_10440 [compost metagenome]